MSVWMCGIFLICRLGDDVNGRFHEITRMFYSHSCTLGPLQSDKRFSKMISIAKEPIYLYGCFNIRCIRETFREVSIWRVFRELYAILLICNIIFTQYYWRKIFFFSDVICNIRVFHAHKGSFPQSMICICYFWSFSSRPIPIPK